MIFTQKDMIEKTAEPTSVGSESVDGRRKRSQRSREKIIDALFRLIKDGDPDPSVVSVAKASGVSLRTTFRHFKDLNSIFIEMSQQLKDELNPIVYAPYESKTWRGKLQELIARRAMVFERTMHAKMSGDRRRHRSQFLMSDYLLFIERERATLLDVLPKNVTRNKRKAESLLMALSFQSWTQMRLQQDLEPSEAEEVMHTIATALLGE